MKPYQVIYIRRLGRASGGVKTFTNTNAPEKVRANERAGQRRRRRRRRPGSVAAERMSERAKERETQGTRLRRSARSLFPLAFELVLSTVALARAALVPTRRRWRQRSSDCVSGFCWRKGRQRQPQRRSTRGTAVWNEQDKCEYTGGWEDRVGSAQLTVVLWQRRTGAVVFVVVVVEKCSGNRLRCFTGRCKL
jgi:hypothetical protein